MKGKKDHDSDDEREDEPVEQTTNASTTQVDPSPISPPSDASRRSQVSDAELERVRYTYMEDPEGGVLFEEQSMMISCPHCGTKALSIVEYQNNFLGYLIALILLFALGWLSFIILPLVLSLTKNGVHRCAKCLNEVKNNSLLGFNSMEDKVLSLQIGTFGIIISRRYLLYIVLCILCAIVLYLLLSFGIGHNEERPLTNLKWADFKDDCGKDAYTKNARVAINKFDKTYLGQGVTWDGYIVQVSAMDEDTFEHYSHASNIMVKMVPDDKGEDDPSLALTFSENMTEKFKEELLQLDVGDHIAFNATIVGLGTRNSLHHLHTFGIKKIEGTAHVNLHTHRNSRYKVATPREEIQKSELPT